MPENKRVIVDCVVRRQDGKKFISISDLVKILRTDKVSDQVPLYSDVYIEDLVGRLLDLL